MKENLEVALAWVLAHEGGFVNHPKDPGGATNKGVTQRVYDGYRTRKGLAPRSVRGISAEEVAEIYRAQYWQAVRGDDLPAGLDYAVFDYAVNSGPRRAAMDLQRELGVKVDGVIGQITLAACARADVFDLIVRLCERRMRFLRALKHWPTFGRGWTRRVMGQHEGAQDDDTGVIDRAIGLAAGEAARAQAPVAPVPGKAEERERESVMESTTVQASAVQVASGLGGGVAAVGALEGPAQIAVIVACAVVVVAALWIMRERIKKWASGEH
jgi:lysozyme family protein